MKKKVIALLGTCFLSMGLLFIPATGTIHTDSCGGAFSACNNFGGGSKKDVGVNINVPTQICVITYKSCNNG